VTAHQPPNPYAPSQALAHDAQQASPGKPSRVGALITALLCYPLPGPGFYLLGRPGRFRAWLAAGVVAWALVVAGVWLPVPKLFVIAMTVLLASWLTSVAATAITKPAAVGVKRALLTAVLMIVAVRVGTFAVAFGLVEAFHIPSGAMMPTLRVGDRLMIRKGHGHIQRGDIVVFKYPRDPSTDYVKRVVAAGGDTVEVRGGVLMINGSPLGQPLDEPCTYRDEHAPIPDGAEQPCKLLRETNAGRAYTIMQMPDRTAADFPPQTIGAGEVFVMGDNRDNSHDSRHWGPLPVALIKGTATLTWWSQDANGIHWSRVGRAIE
jgi:signal peptidase I